MLAMCAYVVRAYKWRARLHVVRGTCARTHTCITKGDACSPAHGAADIHPMKSTHQK